MKATLAIGTITLVTLLGIELLVSVLLPVYLSPPDYFDDFLVPDPKLGYRIKPNFYGEFKQDYDQVFAANTQGFRDRDYGPKDDSVLRILAIGDSFTFGSGVSLEQTWVKQLESALLQRNITGEVINAGIFGYGTLQYSRVLARLAPVYEPDVIIVMITSNDPGNDLATDAGVYPPLNSGRHVVKNWLKRHSHLSRRLWLLYLRAFKPKHSYVEADSIHQEAGPRTDRAYELFDAALREIDIAAKQAGAWLILTASQPLSGDKISCHLKAISEERSITLIDAFRSNSVVDFSPRNSAGHWSPEGHREVGIVLAKRILESGGLSRWSDLEGTRSVTSSK